MIDKLIDKISTDMIVGLFLGVALLMSIVYGAESLANTIGSAMAGYLGRSAIPIVKGAMHNDVRENTSAH